MAPTEQNRDADRLTFISPFSKSLKAAIKRRGKRRFILIKRNHNGDYITQREATNLKTKSGQDIDKTEASPVERYFISGVEYDTKLWQ